MSRPKITKSGDMKRCNFDVNGELFEKFQDACEAKLTTPSLVFRHFIKTYVDEFERDTQIKQQLAKEITKEKKRR